MWLDRYNVDDIVTIKMQEILDFRVSFKCTVSLLIEKSFVFLFFFFEILLNLFLTVVTQP